MKGTLPAVAKVLTGALPEPDPARLALELARHLGVPPRRLFLTHGATEANALALFYLRRSLKVNGSATARWTTPEYPPLWEAAHWAGFRRTARPAHVVVLSSPNNPTGHAVTPDGVRCALERARWAVVDETFREFTARPSLARTLPGPVFATGTFTKAWGGDALRVGFVVVPPSQVEGFAAFHGIVADELPLHSVSAARAFLAAGDRILGESRARFRTNLAALTATFPEVVGLDAPVWFDRLNGAVNGERFARALLRRGVLVCPGKYFGASAGVRLCLTQPSFPADLAVYLTERRQWG